MIKYDEQFDKLVIDLKYFMGWAKVQKFKLILQLMDQPVIDKKQSVN